MKEDVWINTSCGGCYGQCGIRVHRVDGVIVDIEGNPYDTLRPASYKLSCKKNQS
ncbi:MAG: hypothetical protein HY738_17495 [Bacteroidia bacterium]|nr:hypothetical protein [Bacteroidia bacterium]